MVSWLASGQIVVVIMRHLIICTRKADNYIHNIIYNEKRIKALCVPIFLRIRVLFSVLLLVQEAFKITTRQAQTGDIQRLLIVQHVYNFGHRC
jgi:hypothetical protein